MIKVNGYKVEVTTFPNNESLIKSNFKNWKQAIVSVEFKFESDADLVHLMMIKHELDSVNTEAILRMPYVPYSRMDRTGGENVFTLKAVANMINSMNFKEVHILEPHSDVCVALLDRVIPYEYTITELLPYALKKTNLNIEENDFIVFPDGGAEKRYAKKVKGANVLTAIKHRDFTTGDITSLEVVGEAKEGFNAIIVDDLCSKGGTFMLTANKLKEMGANKIYLAITHCENNILNGDVLKKDSPIEKVFTTNSIFDTSFFNMAKEQLFMKYGRSIELDKLDVREVI